MVKGRSEKSEDSTKTKKDIFKRGIDKKSVKGKKLASVGGEAHLSAAASGSSDEFAGYIFLCNGKTKPECFSYRVFGLPSMKIDIVAKIIPGTKLFLFDFDVKLLYGVYSATSTGTMHLEPLAFGGRFPAQVRFEIFKECMPMPESKFKHVIKDNYQGGSKFRQNLSANQVENLISLFRPLPLLSPSETHVSLLSKESQSRQILQQEIEKQSRSLDISTLTQQAPGSQYIDSKFAYASFKAQPLSLPLYDSGRLLSSTDLAHERTGGPSQLYPSSKLLQYDDLYHPELPRHSYLAEYSSSNPGLHGLASGYVNGPLLSRIDVNHRMVLPNDYYIYQNQNIGQGYIPQQISAPSIESDRAPSSVLAAAYWVAVANEIPQPSVHQTSYSGHNMTGQDNSSTSVQYKPPNLTSQSILDAYWEAKNLEDSRQAHPDSSHMLPHSSQQSVSTTTIQGSVFPASHAYYSDQSHMQHPQPHPVLISSQGGIEGAFPTGDGNGSGTETATPARYQQQVVYQTQHGAVPPYYPPYTL